MVIGAGGHAKVVIATARLAGWDVTMAFDDDVQKVGSQILGVPVVGVIAEAVDVGCGAAVLALGGNRVRARLADELPLDWASIAHPAATVHETVRLRPGVTVFAGAIVQPDTIVGSHSIINTAGPLSITTATSAPSPTSRPRPISPGP